MNKRLKHAIIESGRPQYIIAQELGIAETALSRIVHRGIVPRPAMQRKIAKVLGVTPEELFDGKER